MQTKATLCPVRAYTSAAEEEIRGGHEGEDVVQAGEGPGCGAGGRTSEYSQEHGVLQGDTTQWIPDRYV